MSSLRYQILKMEKANRIRSLKDNSAAISVTSSATFASAAVVVYFYYMLYAVCNDPRYRDELQCSRDNFPMISDLGKNHPYDRWFAAVFVLYITCNSLPLIRQSYINISARVSDNRGNTMLFWFGAALMPVLPSIAFWDEDTQIHGTLATIYFFGNTCYLLILTGYYVMLKATFNERSQTVS